MSLAGFKNTALTEYSSILGGKDNEADGSYGAVSGGQVNVAS